MFCDPVGPPSDTWALACLLFRIFSHGCLFASFFGERDEILVEMVRTLGRLPDRWWSQWEKRADYFAEDGTGYAGDKRTSKMDMQARLKALDRNPPDGLQPEEIAAFEHILLAMLRFEADKRMSAEEVVQLLPGVCGTGGSSA